TATQTTHSLGVGGGSLSQGTFAVFDNIILTRDPWDETVAASPTQVPDIVTSLEYDHPWLGAATASIVDPVGLNLRTETSYEQPRAAGWLRRLDKRLPAAVASGQSAATAGSTFA